MSTKHINYSNAFNIAAGSYLYNSARNFLKNKYGSYSLVNDNPMAGYGSRQRFRLKRGGSRTITKRRKFKRQSRLAKRVKRISRTLHRKGLKSIEIKYLQGTFETPNTLAGPGAVGTLLETGGSTAQSAKVNLTSQVARGLTRDGRVGDKVFIRHIRLRGLLQASVATNAASEVYVTVMVVRVKNAGGSTTTLATEIPYLQNIFEFIGSTSSLSTPPNGQNGGRGAYINNWNYVNARYKDDFQILKKKTYRIGKPDGNPPLKVMFKMNIPIFKPAYWDDTNNPQDGHVYLYYWCDQVTFDDRAITAGDRPVMWASWRTSYTDC